MIIYIITYMIIYDNLYNFLLFNFSEPAKASKIKKETIELSNVRQIPITVKHT